MLLRHVKAHVLYTLHNYHKDNCNNSIINIIYNYVCLKYIIIILYSMTAPGYKIHNNNY